MSQYALVDANNVVQNLAVWDGVTPWTPPPGMTAVLVPNGVACGIGYTFSAPSTFVFGQLPAQVFASNEAAILNNVANALVRLRQIQTQASTFQAQVPYTVANLANLNDLLAKSQLIAAAVNDIAGDLIGVARLLSDQFDGTS